MINLGYRLQNTATIIKTDEVSTYLQASHRLTFWSDHNQCLAIYPSYQTVKLLQHSTGSQISMDSHPTSFCRWSSAYLLKHLKCFKNSLKLIPKQGWGTVQPLLYLQQCVEVSYKQVTQAIKNPNFGTDFLIRYSM